MYSYIFFVDGKLYNRREEKTRDPFFASRLPYSRSSEGWKGKSAEFYDERVASEKDARPLFCAPCALFSGRVCPETKGLPKDMRRVQNSSPMPRTTTVPFFSNTEDNKHCFQAALRMVLGYFRPDLRYNWDELDKITAHTANWTWPAAGLLHCVNLGLDVVVIDAFDFDRFIAEGYNYLVEWHGREVADAQRKNSNLDQEVEYIKTAKDKIRIENRIPERSDLAQIVDNDSVVICHLNAAALVAQPGYSGHFVVITGLEAKGVRLHDPGLPGLENMIVSWGRFARAWGYPEKKNRSIIGFRGIVDSRKDT